MCSYCYLFCICSVAHSAITVVPNFPVIVKHKTMITEDLVSLFVLFWQLSF